jgi:universal stress protein A
MQHLGEVAGKVVRRARRSVLVARPGPGSGKILAATDFSDPSLPAITSAAEEARRRGASLTVVHNVDPELNAFGAVLQFFPDEFMAELGRGARDRLLDVLQRLGVAAEAVITRGPASFSILRLAESLPADLVVVGNSGGTGLANVLVGSVAERVVRWAPCSVLVVRRRV